MVLYHKKRAISLLLLKTKQNKTKQKQTTTTKTLLLYQLILSYSKSIWWIKGCLLPACPYHLRLATPWFLFQPWWLSLLLPNSSLAPESEIFELSLPPCEYYPPDICRAHNLIFQGQSNVIFWHFCMSASFQFKFQILFPPTIPILLSRPRLCSIFPKTYSYLLTFVY